MTREELRERIAKALYCANYDGDKRPWAERLDWERELYLISADAVLAEIAAAGLVLVPREPTGDMLSAGEWKIMNDFTASEVYRAMIAAATSDSR